MKSSISCLFCCITKLLLLPKWCSKAGIFSLQEEQQIQRPKFRNTSGKHQLQLCFPGMFKLIFFFNDPFLLLDYLSVSFNIKLLQITSKHNPEFWASPSSILIFNIINNINVLLTIPKRNIKNECDKGEKVCFVGVFFCEMMKYHHFKSSKPNVFPPWHTLFDLI